ncbi:MAG TPA: class I SAM-dependent methyltransferase [Candidatus Limnocylindrales bacterium]|nr:class I SAM-dependent methyltransferase [Candidatus Limnocylindrales bacterium]
MTSARDQFSRTADAYVTSAQHKSGPDLAKLLAIAAPTGDETYLDVATGTGHTLRTFAPHVRRAVGLDLTPAMLAAARRANSEEGVRAMLIEGDVTAVPLADRSVDLATCRIAAHHFPDVHGAFAEVARVLRPGAAFLFVDNYAPDDPGHDAFVNELERLRDPSHAREHTLDGWSGMLRAAGFDVAVADRWETEIDVEDWLARGGTAPDAAAEVRRRLAAAEASTRRAFSIAPGRFRLRKAILVGRRR